MESLREKELILDIKQGRGLERGLARAAEILISGGAVAFPTESFYGLGVNVSDEEAIHRLFDIKKRREDHPVLILIPSREALVQYVTRVPDTAGRLMDQFWPGGLTIVLEAGPGVSHLLTADTGKIGVRLSSHPVATGLALAAGLAITGTSANVSGEPPCTDAAGVLKSIGRSVDLILDAGKTMGGKGSTVLDMTVDPPLIVREGMIGRDRLEAFIAL